MYAIKAILILIVSLIYLVFTRSTESTGESTYISRCCVNGENICFDVGDYFYNVDDDEKNQRDKRCETQQCSTQYVRSSFNNRII